MNMEDSAHMLEHIVIEPFVNVEHGENIFARVGFKEDLKPDGTLGTFQIHRVKPLTGR